MQEFRHNGEVIPNDSDFLRHAKEEIKALKAENARLKSIIESPKVEHEWTYEQFESTFEKLTLFFMKMQDFEVDYVKMETEGNETKFSFSGKELEK